MEEKEKPIRLDVHMEPPQLLDRLVVFVEEQEGPPGCFRTTHLGGTYILDTGERLWSHRTEKNGHCFLEMKTYTVDAEFKDVAPVYPVRICTDDSLGEETGWVVLRVEEDKDADPVLPAFRAKQRHEARAMGIALHPWGPGHTQLVARWWQPEGETWAKRLLFEVAEYRPEVRAQLAQQGISLAGQGLSERVNTSEHTSYFPTTERGRALWRTRDTIMLALEAEVRKRSEKDEQRAPTPTMDEYVRNLAKLDGSGKRLSERHVRRILKARKEGRLTQ